jgi:hypothetical protein
MCGEGDSWLWVAFGFCAQAVGAAIPKMLRNIVSNKIKSF